MTKPRLCAGLVALLALAACKQAPPEQVEPVRLFADVQPFSIGNDTRLGVLLHEQRQSARATVVLPAAAELSFGYAVNAAVPEASRGEIAEASQLSPVALSLSLRHENGARELLFEQRVDPRVPSERRWVDASADLSRWQGERVELEFALHADPGGVTPVAAFWEPTLHSAGAKSERPNLLVVSLDTLRARNVGAYGHERDTTPFLDQLAESGVLFENAITASVSTGPSHMSLFTGLYPVHHGMRRGQEPRSPSAVPLALLLRRAGYHTAAFTEDGYLIRIFGFGDGFSEYSENTGSHGAVPGEAQVTFERAERWLARSRRRPFFLFVHTYEVHAPYMPPAETANLFRSDGEPGTAAPDLRSEQDDYDREIRFVDDKVRELIGALERNGLRNSTTVVVLSDHGEEFGEHGYFQHGTALFEESLRVPLIFEGWGIPAGERVAGQVSLIDVTPTLLALVGVQAPAGLDGENLLPAMHGKALPERELFAEAMAPGRWRRPLFYEPFNPPLVAMRSQHGKLLVHRPTEGAAAPAMRIDLDSDSLELAPQALAGDELAAAQARVDSYLRGKPSEPAAPAPPLDPELRKRLEGLGYVGETN
ncbi:MAG TPA: sulfatase [Myxococcota bacterium]|nr:sulfatase [Myxococcota bacterium]